jgi:hypothetical protein
VHFALDPRFLDGLVELPVVEAGAKAVANRLGTLRTVIVTESKISESKRFWQLPTVTVVHIAECINASAA